MLKNMLDPLQEVRTTNHGLIINLTPENITLYGAAYVVGCTCGRTSWHIHGQEAHKERHACLNVRLDNLIIIDAPCAYAFVKSALFEGGNSKALLELIKADRDLDTLELRILNWMNRD